MEEKHCLKDVISGTDADSQIRCNQIWAVSMPFTMLDEEKEKQVVNAVFEKLYTPYGLRTLAQEDTQFCPFYGGEVLARDLAYHQGTVWAYPLGAYYLAYLKVNGYSREAKAETEAQLEVLESALREDVSDNCRKYTTEKILSRQKGLFCPGLECRRAPPGF